MAPRAFTTLSLYLIALASTVKAHGYLCDLKTEIETYTDIYGNVGWVASDSESRRTFLNPKDFASPNFVCGMNYKPGSAEAEVSAGSTVKLSWCSWPHSHRGPIIDYLANCDGDFDPTELKWFKIAEEGLITPNVIPTENWPRPQIGYWATDKLIDQADRFDVPTPGADQGMGYDAWWDIKIPSSIKPGRYCLRSEIVNLGGGTQLFPRCVTLRITGDGTATPEGVPAAQLYRPDEPGIVAVYRSGLDNYTIPGPEVYQDGAADAPGMTNGTAVAVMGTGSPSTFITRISTSSPASSTVGAAGQSRISTTNVPTGRTTEPQPTASARPSKKCSKHGPK